MTPEQLRTSILQYAMEGKLVKQDSNDEPASELVKRSQDKKIELIKNGELKKSKKLPVITDGEKPFNIPDNWAWSRLGDLFTILRGGSPRPIKSFLTNDENGINWIKIGDTDPNSKYITKTEEKIIPEGLKKSRAVHIGDFVLSNSMSFGRPYILKINGAVHDGWLIISDYDQVFNKDFLYYLLLSSFVKKQFSIAATGSTVKNLNRERVANTIGVIPPLEEQKRIVAKIEKLMPLVDEYAESYNRLQKIDNEFEDKLKQSVLQYAMEGKLVKQNPSDEPASELVKASSMEKSHNESYKIPSSWEWIRLGSGVKFINGRAYKKTELLTDSNLTPVLRVGNLFTNSSWYYSDLKLDEDKYIDNGDLIYAWSASFGPRIWNGGHVIYHYHIWKTVIKKSIDKKFLYYFLSDPHNVLGETKLHGSTMKHVTKTNMEKLPFPLPPLEEQKRIVAKIEKIMNSINNH